VDEKEYGSKILIIYNYHPKEIFAAKVGKHFLQTNLNSHIKISEYNSRPDRNKSAHYLRQFAENFNPVISPIVLHADDNHFDAAIIYRGKSKKEVRVAQKPLLDFSFSQYAENQLLVCFGRFIDYNTKCSIIDIELNARMGLQRAVDLVQRFSQYLISLYLDKGVRM